MAELASSGTPDGTVPGASDEVSNDAPATVSVDDFKRMQSTLDRQVAERDSQLAQMKQQLDSVSAQRREAEVKDLTPSEQVAYERDELRSRLATMEKQNEEIQARENYARQVAQATGVDVSVLLAHDTPESMLKAAVDNRVSAATAPADSGASTPVVSSGATLTEAPKELSQEEAAAAAFESGDMRAFTELFMPK